MGEQDTENQEYSNVVEQQVVAERSRQATERSRQATERSNRLEQPNRSIWLGGLGLLVLLALAPVYGSRPTIGKTTDKIEAKTAPTAQNTPASEPVPSPSPIATVALAKPTPQNSPTPQNTPAPQNTPVPTAVPTTPEATNTGPRLSLEEAEKALRIAVPNLSLPFPPHSSELGITQRRALERVADILKRSPVTTIELGGYAEEEVQNSRMVSLGISRVRMSAMYMISKGAPLEQIVGVSYGARTFSPNAPASGIEIRINKKN
jgi:outer membrane protein OmpA-like peptidoglycan-associated protein